MVTLRSTADSVVYSFYQQQKAEDSNTEAVRLVETAAKLIRNDIKAVEMCNESYPTNDQMGSTEEALKFLPSLLNGFLRILFTGKKIEFKLASVGQAIMQSTN